MKVIKKNGKVELVSTHKITEFLNKTLVGLKDISIHDLVEEATSQLYDNIKTEDIDKVLILACRQKIQYEPEYSYAAARILLYSQYRKSFNKKNDKRSLHQDYRKSFIDGVSLLIKEGKLNRKLLEVYNLSELADNLIPENDLKFKYLGIKTVLDRYCWRDKSDNIVELPQSFWMRVAMGVCHSEPDAQELCIKIYKLISGFYFTFSTPTLFNSGKTNSQLSSCFLSTMDDDIDSIMGTIHGQARLSKNAGGLAMDMSRIRASGTRISSTGGKAAGPIRYMKIINDTILAFDQGGKRPGVCCVYLPPWHKDIFAFLDVRKNTGDERLRCHDLNTANWIPDEFMVRVENNDDWYLFCPKECPELNETYGEEFSKYYNNYINKAESGKLKNWGKVKAKDLWREILKKLLSSGHPWINFKDSCNIRYANKHAGIVRSSNLCTEILEHTIPTKYKDEEIFELGETATCNLGSLCIPSFYNKETEDIDWALLKETIPYVVRALDLVITNGYYPTKEARKASENYRYIGQGIMGIQDLLHLKKLPFKSPKALKLNDKLYEFISYYSIKASIDLAKRIGKYPRFEGSEWSKGKMPIDSYKELMQYRKQEVEVVESLDWDLLRAEVKEHGIRNSTLLAIAPTVSISSITGFTPSIEPSYSVLHTNTGLSGSNTMIDEYFVKEMKELGLWNKDLAKKIQSHNGDVSKLDIPLPVKERFKTAFQINQHDLIALASVRQKWIDQSQSLNLYYDGDSLKEVSNMYFDAWKKGVKTTYYLKTLGASDTEKLSNKPIEKEEPKVCSRDNPNCESCE